MIVKNEEAILHRALKSVRDFMDEIIVVDTGSTDNTVEIARSLGANVQHFEWCNDFSAARNYALSFVKTPWAMWLDADDICLNPELIHDLTQDAHKQKINGLWGMYWQDASCYQGRLQIFKTKLFKWQGVVHENPVPRSRAFNESAMTDLEVLHLKPKERTQQAAEHYLQILLEKDPQNYFGLAESYKFLKQTELAEEHYWLAFKHPEANDSTKYASLFNCALLNYELSDKEPERLDIAMKTCAVAISLLPERAECYSLLGMCNHVLNDKVRAKECYETALSKPEHQGAELVFHRFAKQIPQAGLEQLSPYS